MKKLLSVGKKLSGRSRSRSPEPSRSGAAGGGKEEEEKPTVDNGEYTPGQPDVIARDTVQQEKRFMSNDDGEDILESSVGSGGVSAVAAPSSLEVSVKLWWWHTTVFPSGEAVDDEVSSLAVLAVESTEKAVGDLRILLVGAVEADPLRFGCSEAKLAEIRRSAEGDQRGQVVEPSSSGPARPAVQSRPSNWFYFGGNALDNESLTLREVGVSSGARLTLELGSESSGGANLDAANADLEHPLEATSFFPNPSASKSGARKGLVQPDKVFHAYLMLEDAVSAGEEQSESVRVEVFLRGGSSPWPTVHHPDSLNLVVVGKKGESVIQTLDLKVNVFYIRKTPNGLGPPVLAVFSHDIDPSPSGISYGDLPDPVPDSGVEKLLFKFPNGADMAVGDFSTYNGFAEFLGAYALRVEEPKDTGYDIGIFGTHDGVLGTDVLKGIEQPTLEESLSVVDALTRANPCAIVRGFQVVDAKLIQIDSAGIAHLMRLADDAHCNGDLDTKVDLSHQQLRSILGGSTVDRLIECFSSRVDEIKLHRVASASGSAHQVINFHLDSSLKTMQVPLNDDSEYSGSRLVYATRTGFSQPRRTAGMALIHDNSIPHGVTAITSGIRYGLFLLTRPN